MKLHGRPEQELPAVRPARIGDAHDVARIYIESWNSGFGDLMGLRTFTNDLIERWQVDLVELPPHRWWVAELEGSIVGFAGIRPSRDPADPDTGELDTIAVDPTRWRNGIGWVLMTVALHHLAADGYRRAVLWTLADYDLGQRFYEATGWKLDGGVRDEGRQLRYWHDLHK